MTSARVTWDLVDPTARGDAIVAASDVSPLSKLDRLHDESGGADYATTELNRWTLDGSKSILPDDDADADVAYWSDALSDADGEYAEPITLTIAFGAPHKSLGLSLEFDRLACEWAARFRAVFSAADGTALLDLECRPESAEYATGGLARGYTTVTLTAYASSLPYRRLRVAEVMYGVRRALDGQLVSGRLTEGISLTAASLPIGTQEVGVIDPAIDVTDPDGAISALMTMQPLRVAGRQDGETVPLGTYYLAEWRCRNDGVHELRAEDVVGMLDRRTWLGGLYDGEPVGDVVAAIFALVPSRFVNLAA